MDLFFMSVARSTPEKIEFECKDFLDDTQLEALSSPDVLLKKLRSASFLLRYFTDMSTLIKRKQLTEENYLQIAAKIVFHFSLIFRFINQLPWKQDDPFLKRIVGELNTLYEAFEDNGWHMDHHEASGLAPPSKKNFKRFRRTFRPSEDNPYPTEKPGKPARELERCIKELVLTEDSQGRRWVMHAMFQPSARLGFFSQSEEKSEASVASQPAAKRPKING